jgi:hypothetical protein
VCGASEDVLAYPHCRAKTALPKAPDDDRKK